MGADGSLVWTWLIVKCYQLFFPSTLQSLPTMILMWGWRRNHVLFCRIEKFGGESSGQGQPSTGL